MATEEAVGDGIVAPQSGSTREAWTVVDEGWGRRAVEFATLSEPANCRKYVAMHQLLADDVGDEVLDIACGAGLARPA